jgi:hypothetical protein
MSSAFSPLMKLIKYEKGQRMLVLKPGLLQRVLAGRRYGVTSRLDFIHQLIIAAFKFGKSCYR